MSVFGICDCRWPRSLEFIPIGFYMSQVTNEKQIELRWSDSLLHKLCMARFENICAFSVHLPFIYMIIVKLSLASFTSNPIPNAMLPLHSIVEQALR